MWVRVANMNEEASRSIAQEHARDRTHGIGRRSKNVESGTLTHLGPG
jgi:hypothetical protein